MVLTHFLEDERGNVTSACIKPLEMFQEYPVEVDNNLLQEITVKAPLVISSDPPVLDLGSFVLSISLRSNFRRLHRFGDCPNRPGIEFKKYEVCGMQCPPASSFDARCLRCFPEDKKGRAPLEADLGNESPTTSGSSSDSSGS